MLIIRQLFSRLPHAAAWVASVCCARSFYFPEDWPWLRPLAPYVFALAVIGMVLDSSHRAFTGLFVLGFLWTHWRFQARAAEMAQVPQASCARVQFLEYTHRSKHSGWARMESSSTVFRMWGIPKGASKGDVYEVSSSRFRPIYCRAHAPGAFCFLRWNFDKGAGFTLFLDAPSKAVAKGTLPLQYRLRAWVQNRLNARYGSQDRPWVSALLLGDKSQLSPRDIQLSQSTGIMHVLAISGMHVSLLFHGVAYVLVLLPLRNKARAAVTLLLLLGVWCYAWICLMPASVLRAALFVTWQTLGRQVLRQSCPITKAWPVVLVLQLMLRPGDLFDLGFQLSYWVTAVLIYAVPFFPQRSKIAQWFWLTTLCALAAFPVLVHYFKAFSWGFWLGSLILAPLLLWLLPLLWVGLLWPDMPGLDQLILGIFHRALLGLEKISWPYSVYRDFSIYQTFAWLGLFGFLISVFIYSQKENKF